MNEENTTNGASTVTGTEEQVVVTQTPTGNVSGDGYEEVKPKSNYIKFNKVDDYIQGTLIEVFKPQQPDNYGRMDTKYTILCEEGKIHIGKNDEAGNYVIDANPTPLTRDEEYIVTGGKAGVDKPMKEVQIGQKVVVKLNEFVPSKKAGYKPAKSMKILKGPMNQEWISQQDIDLDKVF